MGFWSNILDYILPPRCARCGKIIGQGAGLCSDCFNEIDFISKPCCSRCGHPFATAPQSENLLCPKCLKDKKPVFRMCRSAFKYTDKSKQLILSFKFYDKTENAPTLAQMMFVAGRDIFESGVDVIVPIPLHFNRY